MNRFSLFLTIAVLALSVSGCDFFRKIAGRPTSEDIALKKNRIEEIERRRAEAEELMVNDTTSRPASEPVEQPASEPVEQDILSSLLSQGIKVSGSKMVSESVRNLIKSRYVIIIGAFGSPANAEAQAKRAGDLSYQTVLIPYSNGLTAVGLCPSDNLSECSEALKSIREEEFCPADAWILDNSL